MQVVERSESEYARLLPHPDQNVNKFTRGSVAVIAGSAHFPGAAVLATAAARCGSGYTVLVTPSSAAQAAHAHLVSIPVHEAPEEEGTFCLASFETAQHASRRAQVLAVGSGIGLNNNTTAFLKALLENDMRPMVLDADALTILAKNPQFLTQRQKAGAITIATPHEGEAARFLGRAVTSCSDDAMLLAQKLQGIVALKGARTFIADAHKTCIMCSKGGPELAKAGSGDVLAGMVAGLLSQGLSAIDATALAVYVHAKAGNLAAKDLTDISVMPEDIVSYIGAAFKEIERS